MKLGTTKTSRIAGSRKNSSASRRLGSSFQKPHATSAKIPRRRISAACISVGALESGFTVEPWPTIRSALVEPETMGLTGRGNVERSTLLRKATAGRLSQVEFRKVAVLRRCPAFAKLISDAFSHLQEY